MLALMIAAICVDKFAKLELIVPTTVSVVSSWKHISWQLPLIQNDFVLGWWSSFPTVGNVGMPLG
jgi:hypothetical protein